MPPRNRPKRYTVRMQNYVNLYNLILALGLPEVKLWEENGVKIWRFYDVKNVCHINYFWTVKDNADPNKIASECPTLSTALEKYNKIIKPDANPKDITIIPLVEINKRKHFNTIAICDKHACLIEPRSSNRQILFGYDINPIKIALENTNLKFHNLFTGQQSCLNDEDCGAHQINHTTQLAKLTTLVEPTEIKEHLKLRHLDERNDDNTRIKLVRNILWNEKENQLNISCENIAELSQAILKDYLKKNSFFTYFFDLFDFTDNEAIEISHKSYDVLNNIPKYRLFLSWLQSQKIKHIDRKLSESLNHKNNSKAEYYDWCNLQGKSSDITDIFFKYSVLMTSFKNSILSEDLNINNEIKVPLSTCHAWRYELLQQAKISAAMELLEKEYTNKYCSAFFKILHTRHQSATWLKENLLYAKDSHAAAVFVYRYYQAIPEFGSALSQTLEKIMVKLLDIETRKFEQALKQRNFATTFDKGTDPIIALIQQKLRPETNKQKDSSQETNSANQQALKELYEYINSRETSFKYKVLTGKAKSNMDEKLTFARSLITCLSCNNVDNYETNKAFIYFNQSPTLLDEISQIKKLDTAIMHDSKLNEILNKLKLNINSNLTHSKG